MAIFIAGLFHFYTDLISFGVYTNGFRINSLLRCKKAICQGATPANLARYR